MSLIRRLTGFVRLYLGLVALGAICLTWTPLALLLYPLLPARAGRLLGRWVISRGFRMYLGGLSLMGACRFDLDEVDALRGSGPMILAPNHPCLLDALMIVSRLPDVACVMKAALIRNVFMGAGARMARYIRNEPLIAMIRGAVDSLHAGQHLLLFPEGTRSVRTPVSQFQKSLALIACRARVPVQTLIIETDSGYLRKGWPLFRRPAMPIHFRVRLGRRFPPPDGDIARYTAELEAWFAAELAAPSLVPPAPAGAGPDALADPAIGKPVRSALP